ncbi:dTDP-6-deoxy-L-hexose 3-O-methyltransferase [Roseibium sp. TrichSKD4]|uniref:TylF/MycF/NovP-related O-methyltransferase n=1 Tax=Roseibium sp. TrichSKD4 TaxID=744980 RepID=UPI0001E57783|nr:TylF/MycF/NovP-related O-methyltransferase [Roseibium sp. TrichSKD4]EFO29538.1 dTDP-6-deoxy-L-hexose 3-O-methyltransferase [Roseibium sp. TrichSKD4]
MQIKAPPYSSIQGLNPADIWDYENGYHWFSDPTRINKVLAQYELYKKIIDLPGDILELGVFKGLSLLRFASFRNCLEDQSSRKIFGFDTFGEFPTDQLSHPGDLAFIKNYVATAGSGLKVEDLETILASKNLQNIELIAGNILKTIPEFLAQKPAIKISILHLDMDVLEPTAFALEQLYDRVVPGGLLVFDDYQAVVGATLAIDNFITKKSLRLQKLPYYSVPSFVVKP